MNILVMGDFHGKFSRKLKDRLKKEEFDVVVGVGDYAGADEWRPYFKEFFKGVRRNGAYLSAEEYFGKRKYKRLVKKDYDSGKKVLKEIAKLGKPSIIIFGNSDNYYYPFEKWEGDKRKSHEKFARRFKNLKNINYGNAKLKGIYFLGFGGYMEPVVNFKSDKNDESGKKRRERRLKRSERTNKKLFSLIKKMKSKDIFVFHYPPEGVFDIIMEKGNPYKGESAGVSIFGEVVKKNKPKIVLCGHMHEYKGVKKLGKSLVINPGEAAKDNYAIVEWPELKVKLSK